MTDANDGTALSTAEAAEHLRRLRDTLGPDQLREAFETGGGLMEHEENRLRQALDVLGAKRSAEILDIEVPDSGLPGEQVTIGGEPVSGRVPEERAEPVPDDTASLSEFERDDEEGDGGDVDEGVGTEESDCEAHQSTIERLLNSARRQGFLEYNEFDQAVRAAERDGCVSSADATRLSDTGQSAAPEPSPQEFDQLLEDIQRAFGVEEDTGESKDRPGGTTEAAALSEEEAVEVVQRALDIEGPDAIAAFLDPDEIAPLGQATSFQLSGAVETLGEDRVRDIVGL